MYIWDDIITTIFVKVDDFCKKFEEELKSYLIEKRKSKKRNRDSRLSKSEIMSIIIFFHIVKYRTFKDYYTKFVNVFLKEYFPNLVSYNRFVELKKQVLLYLYFFIHSNKGEKTGIYYIDSTSLEVCHIKREKQNRVFKGLACKSKTSKGWFFGFKLHLVTNEKGEIISFYLSKANKSDNDISLVSRLTKNLKGLLVGDKGYISKNLFQYLYSQDLKLVTKIKKNMKNNLMDLKEKLLLKKRAIIESVFNKLKNELMLEHTRHRSVINFIVNILSTLAAYIFIHKPSVCLYSQGVYN